MRERVAVSAATDRKVVLVTRQTRLEELVARHHTLSQARFYLEHLGADFTDYLRESEAYACSLRVTVEALDEITEQIQRYLLVQVLIAPGQPAPETREFHSDTWLPSMHGLLNSAFGWNLPVTPLNVSVFVALLCCVLFYIVMWRTRWGYTVRTVGANDRAARYAGMPTRKVIVLAMCVSGSLAGLVALKRSTSC